MFFYSDPAERNFLGSGSVQIAFQSRMQQFYDRFGDRPNSGFTLLEAFGELRDGQQLLEQTIEWRAFPLLAKGSNEEIDGQRLKFQDEYVEWTVEKNADNIPTKITFTTELPEYLEAFAEIGPLELIRAVQDIIPGANPTIGDLYGFNDLSNTTPNTRRQSFRDHLPNNPWNNGQKGILCLTQQFNTMNALFNLVTECSIKKAQGSPGDTCGLVGEACGVGRSSDPRICSESQAAVRSGFGITLKDSAGIRIIRLDGSWKVDSQTVDINNEGANQGVWSVSRNGRRAILDLTKNVTLADDPVTTGAQVSRVLFVGSDIFAAPEIALPDWAKKGNEGMRG